jgi:uncharacterized protein YndB with AHSA1/START domain
MHTDTVSVSKLVHASPPVIFDLLADPAQHPRIDGSGAVREAKPGTARRLALGSTFNMSMKLGIGYSMVSTVIDFEENHRIAWQTRVPGALGTFVGGRIWRYELEPTAGGTTVTESWDISQDRQRWLLARERVAGTTRKNMETTLERIEALVGAS